MTFRRRLYLILEPTERGGFLEKIFEFILVTTIVLNILSIILESVPEYQQQFRDLFHTFEIYSVIFFTVEYITRIYSIVEDHRFRDPVRGRLGLVASCLKLLSFVILISFALLILVRELFLMILM